VHDDKRDALDARTSLRAACREVMPLGQQSLVHCMFVLFKNETNFPVTHDENELYIARQQSANDYELKCRGRLWTDGTGAHG
jgi:hypothetical protein